MPRIEAIIFDKDGTLFDFQATWSAWAVGFLDRLAETAPDAREAMEAAIRYDRAGRRFHPDSVVIAGTPWEVAERLLPFVALERMAVVEIANAVAATTPQVPAVDLHRCLGTLSVGRALGLVTNDGEAPARAHLEQCGIAGYFDFVAGYDSGHGAKPEPGPLLAFAEATGADPAATLMVGDSTHDLEAGRRAGMIPVAVLTGVAGREVLAPHAEVVLNDIGDLSDWIVSGGAGPRG